MNPDPLAGVKALLAAYEAVVEVAWAVLDDAESGDAGAPEAAVAVRILGAALFHVRPHLPERELERAEGVLSRLNRVASP